MAATDKATSTFLPTPRSAAFSPVIRRATRVGRAMTLAAALLAAGAAHAQAPATEKPDPAKAGKIAAEVCAACHGADGNSAAPANPKLAGQHYDYLNKQLHEFKGKDGQPAKRQNAIMGGIVMALSDADMRNLAAFYSTQTLKPAAARNKETVELGQQIYRGGIAAKGVPACAACHSPNGAGIPAQYPHLAGQFAEYTADQLMNFRAGKRQNNAQMMEIAAKLSDAEIQAVADYIAGLR